MRPGSPPNLAKLLAHLAALLLFLAASARPARGDHHVAGEYEIKAAFVYRFTHFTEFRPDTFKDGDSPIVVALVGDDPFGGALEHAVADKIVNGRRLEYRHYPNANALDRCHVLFVSGSERQQLAQILADARGFGALTVGDTDEFTRDGGMIRFIREEDKVRFEIHRQPVVKAGLRLSAQLLKLARIYKE